MAMEIRSGPWTSDQVDQYLRATAIPLRLATAGRKLLVQSLWFEFDGSSLWCASQSDSVLVRRLRKDDRIGFEVSADAPPYRGVRGHGRAHLDPPRAADLLPRLIERYLGSTPSPLADWLLSRIDNEVAIRIDDLTVTSWDYSARM
jgi:hypothetical protein